MATATKTASKNGKAEATIVSIPRLDIRELELSLVGDSPLISHAWSDKAKKMMLAKQKKEAKPGREAKNPEQDYQDSIYRLEDGMPAFPAVAFKQSAVGACRFVKGDIKMTEARGAFHVQGELIALDGEPSMREDMVRLSTGVADIRYRAEFKEWGCTLRLKYNAAALSPAQIINLFNIAGFGVGVGEWRPEKNGSFGMFHVEVQGE